jgi:hypothetical protein
MPVYQPEYAQVAQDMIQRRPAQLFSSPCQSNSTCTANVTVAGFSRNCTEQTLSLVGIESIGPAQTILLHSTGYDIISRNCKNTSFPPGDEYVTYCQVFETYYQLSVEQVAGADPMLNYTSYIRKDGRSNELTVRRCSFVPAFMRMPIVITNRTSVNIPTNFRVSNDENLVETLKGTVSGSSSYAIFGGILQTMRDLYEGYIFFDNMELSQVIQGVGPRQYINESTVALIDRKPLFGNSLRTRYTFSCLDPLEDFTTTLNEVALRYAMKSIPDSDPKRTTEYNNFLTTFQDVRNASFTSLKTKVSKSQIVAVQESLPLAVYKSHMIYTAIAMGLTLVTTLLVAMLLQGYARLGRVFSMSPLEVAKAFDAPLLRDVGSNLTGQDISRALGRAKLRYGEVIGNAQTLSEVTSIENARLLEHEMATLTTSYSNKGVPQRQGCKLQIGTAHAIMRPRNGVFYS